MEHGRFQCNRCGQWFDREYIVYISCEGLFCWRCEAIMMEEAVDQSTSTSAKDNFVIDSG